MGADLLSLAVFAVRAIVWVFVAKRILVVKAIPEWCKKCGCFFRQIRRILLIRYMKNDRQFVSWHWFDFFEN